MPVVDRILRIFKIDMRDVMFLFMIFFIIAMIIGGAKFWAGFHNVDLCVNEMRISHMFNIEIEELTLSGEQWTLAECYLKGLNTLVNGFYLSIFAMFGIGMVLTMLTFNDRKKQEEK